MNFHTVTLLILISTLLFIINAIATEDIDNLRKNNRHGDNAKDINVIVKIDNEEGKEIVKSKAKKIRSQIDRLGIMSITSSYENMMFLRENANIERVEIDYEVSAFGQKSVTEKHLRKMAETTPWGVTEVLQDMDFWSNLDIPKGIVKICIADTGYDHGHMDLPVTKPDVFGWDNPSITNEAWSYDGSGHGTHVAGTIAAIGGNSKGSVGIFPNSMGKSFELIIGKALSQSASALMSDVMNAVEGCHQNNADVISLSLGSSSSSDIVRDFFEDIYNNDVIIIAEAGDKSNNEKTYPASYPSVISVGATDSNKERASFSQYNDQVEISAPGKSIYSTYKDNGHATMDGTSMATAHVAAVAGLLRMYFPECSNSQIRNVLAKTALDIDSFGCDENTGYGLVQAKDAYELLSEGDCGGDIGLMDQPEGGCSQLYNCASDLDCNDGDPCTNDMCFNGFCQSEASCDLCGLIPVQFDVKTNHYPSETTWNIVNTSSNEIVMKGGSYDKANTNYSSVQCLGNGSYSLAVYDSFGDGLVCANDGDSDSGYKLAIDDKIHVTGASFALKEETAFRII